MLPISGARFGSCTSSGLVVCSSEGLAPLDSGTGYPQCHADYPNPHLGFRIGLENGEDRSVSCMHETYNLTLMGFLSAVVHFAVPTTAAYILCISAKVTFHNH